MSGLAVVEVSSRRGRHCLLAYKDIRYVMGCVHGRGKSADSDTIGVLSLLRLRSRQLLTALHHSPTAVPTFAAVSVCFESDTLIVLQLRR